MTFSFNLVLALFLLAPGFALVAGIYSGGFKTRLETSPPPPNSIITLALVTGGALLGHLTWTALYGLGELVAAAAHLGWTLPHPNPYLAALKLATDDDRAKNLGLLWTLANLSALTVLSFVATRLLIGWQLQSHGVVRNALYGWMAEATAVEGAIGYVVTNLELDGAAIGYEGVLDYVTLDSSKQIVSLILTDCELFTLVAKGGIVHRVANSRQKPLENIVLSRDAIRNMAFTPIGLKP